MVRRINFIKQQVILWEENRTVSAGELVQKFRLHYPNLGSFASSISRFKGELRKIGASEGFLCNLKPTQEEITHVKKKE